MSPSPTSRPTLANVTPQSSTHQPVLNAAPAAIAPIVATKFLNASGSRVVTVLCGGDSGEREISLRSGRAVAEALADRGHDVVCADITADRLEALDRPGLEVVFVAMHGGFGEDGRLQQLLEQRAIPYTGSGPAACQLAMSKAATRDTLSAWGVATAPGRVVANRHRPTATNLIDQLGLPLVVKPVHGGSSLHVHIVHTGGELDRALAAVIATGDDALVESFIPGRELTVGLLDGQALPILEACTNRAFFDFTAKYQAAGSTHYVFETGLSPQTVAAVQAAAVATHRALGCRDMSRVDIRLAPDGRPVVLELNAIPGFTQTSLLPKAAARAGISFGDLCDHLIARAITRQTRKAPSVLIEPMAAAAG